MALKRVEDLRVYQEAYAAAMEIYRRSTAWPAEERYALTDQVRRSSRAVCANLAEAWRKKIYPKHFVSKLSDTDAEAAETRVWLSFAKDCGFLNPQAHEDLYDRYDAISGGLVNMMRAPEKWSGRFTREPHVPYATEETTSGD